MQLLFTSLVKPYINQLTPCEMEIETTHYAFGEGKLAILIEAASELEACEKYVKHVESKGNESCWAFNNAYVKAVGFIKKQNSGQY